MRVMGWRVERRAWWGFCKRRQEKVFVMEAVRTCVREIAAATISGSLSRLVAGRVQLEA
jgi:hypothetical protein